MISTDVSNLVASAQQFHRAGNLLQAMDACRQALRLDPRNVVAMHLLGMCQHQTGNSPAAIQLLKQAIEIDPANPPLLNNLSGVYCASGQLEEAIAAAQRAIDLRPDYAEAYSNLGAALQKKGQLSDAAVCLRQAIEFKPNHAALHFNLAGILWESRRFDESAEAYQAALKLAPNAVQVLVGLAQVCAKLGQIEQAELLLNRSIQLEPANAMAHYALSRLKLSAGDFRNGWNEYESRLRLPGTMATSAHPQPMWTGADLAGKTILLQAEQGYGDAIQFVRLAPLLSKRGAHVILEAAPAVKPLFGAIPGIARIVTTGDPIPDFDVRLPLLSLPRAFGVNLQNIPADVPYLSAPAELVTHWREKVGDGRAHFKVGLAWAGNPQHPDDPERTWPLKALASLGKVENVSLFSLQKGDRTRQIRKSGLHLIDYTAELSDFAQTAALIENLDLVIAVDTAVAHLAGAIAKPVWLLLPVVADWRWLRDRLDSPWYPTMKLFRQERGETQAAMGERVAQELGTLVNSAKKSWGRRF